MAVKELQDISIHAPRTGSDGYRCVVAKGCQISIHAPRTGSDEDYTQVIADMEQISIHAPRTGSDGKIIVGRLREGFQSTLPARGATTTKSA